MFTVAKCIIEMNHMLIIIACSYGYKLVCVDDKSRKLVQKYFR